MTQSVSQPPNAAQPLIGPSGHITIPWYRWFYAVAQQAFAGNAALPIAEAAKTTANTALSDAEAAQSAATAAQTTANTALSDATTALSEIAALAPGGSEIAVTVGASPFVYTSTEPGTAIISGGGLANVEISRNGTAWYTTGAFRGAFPLSKGDALRLTWNSAAPTMTFFPR